MKEVKFGFSITNAVAAAKVIAISPGYHASAAEVVAAGFADVDHILADGVLETNLSVAADDSALTADALVSFLRQNKAVLTKMELVSDDSNQWNQKLTFGKSTPFEEPAKGSIKFAPYFSVAQNQGDRIVIDLINGGKDKPIQVGKNDVATLKVVASSTLNVILTFAVDENTI